MFPPLLQMSHITVRYGDLLANDAVSFDVRSGEVHALLGENGAGKSTLMKVLAGLVRAETGSIVLDGHPVQVDSPMTAMRLGIGMVHQHFMLIPSLTVVQNVRLALSEGRSLFPDLRRIAREIRALADRYELDVDPEARISSLSVGEQQRVEIIRALYRGARLLVLDEPTAVLTPQETEGLFAIIRNLTVEGNGVIFISHKLQEVMAISDRISVMRAGRLIETKSKSETSAEQLAHTMVGREVQRPINTRPFDRDAPPVLEIRGVQVTGARGLKALDGIDLIVSAGEIHGIAGVDGNGQDELARVVTGLIRASAGGVWLEGIDITRRSLAFRIRAGLAHIPADRQRTALLMGRSLSDNAVLEQIGDARFSRTGFIKPAAIDAYTRALVRNYDIRARSPQQPVATLSGGNQQKLVLARALERKPRLIVAVQPARGLDIGATEAVHAALIAQAAAGCAVLLISTELDEILALSNRVSVLYSGRLSQPFERDTITRDQLGLLMGGRTLTT